MAYISNWRILLNEFNLSRHVDRVNMFRGEREPRNYNR
jgi:hypothetical protein